MFARSKMMGSTHTYLITDVMGDYIKIQDVDNKKYIFTKKIGDFLAKYSVAARANLLPLPNTNVIRPKMNMMMPGNNMMMAGNNMHMNKKNRMAEMQVMRPKMMGGRRSRKSNRRSRNRKSRRN